MGRIAVIGAIMVDHLLPYGHAEWTTSYGGILYNTLRLAPLVSPWGQVAPVAWIGAAHHPEVVRILAQWPNVDAGRLLVHDDGSDENVLRFTSPTEREETMTRRCPALPRERLAELAAFDWVHFNCITQRELSAQDLAWLRGRVRGVLSMDLHNRAARFDEAGRLSSGPFTDWREWIGSVDVVQMNEHECASILERQPEREEDFCAALATLIDCGPREAVITWGPRGSFLAWREGEERRWARIPPTRHPAVDTTGCGDSFSAAYQSRRLAGEHPVRAALFASAVSGWNATQTGLFDAGDVSRFDAILHEHLGTAVERFEAGWRGETLP